MSTKKDGGPAFPQKASDEDGCLYEPGMSLRDYFAAAALPAIIGATGNFEGRDKIADNAMLAYYHADAMIEARKMTR